MPSAIETLQIRNDRLEEELEDFFDEHARVFLEDIASVLKKKIQTYSNTTYALGYEEGKESRR